MGPVIELCRRCGFDIPVNADACPGCAVAAEAPSRAARQVAGLELPTRSVHALPAIPARRERRVRTIGPARAARAAFAYASLFVLVALAGAALDWVARLERYVTALPAGTDDWLRSFTVAATWVSVATMAIGLLALVAWNVRRALVGWARLQLRRDLAT